jgi:hypothetical protein
MYDESNSSCNIARSCLATPSKPETTKNASDSLDDSANYESPSASDVTDLNESYDTSPDSMQSDASSILVG